VAAVNGAEMVASVTTERPVIFCPDMAAAVRAGRKTVTRRIAELKPPDGAAAAAVVSRDPFAPSAQWELHWCDAAGRRIGRADVRVPYWPGLQLWVRERWRVVAWGQEWLRIAYAADDVTHVTEWCHAPEWRRDDWGAWHERLVEQCSDDCTRAGVPTGADGHFEVPAGADPPTRWRPAIHLPRWAARTVLRVEAVSVEPLWRIDDDEAQREGVPGPCEFTALWEALHGQRPGRRWIDNPLVWRVAFRVVGGKA
jgi:hypothetical protein